MRRIQLIALLGLQYIKFVQCFFIAGSSVIMLEVISMYDANRTLGANVQTVFAGVASISAFLGAIVILKVGNGRTMAGCCLVFGVGAIASYWVNNIELFIVFGSAVPGLGAGTLITCCFVCSASLDREHARFWLTIEMVTMTVSYATGPLIVGELVKLYGWRGSMLIISSIAIQGIPIAMLITIAEQGHQEYKTLPWKGVRTKLKQVDATAMFLVVVIMVFLQETPASYMVDMVFSKGYSEAEASMTFLVMALSTLPGQALFVVVSWRTKPHLVKPMSIVCVTMFAVNGLHVIAETYATTMAVSVATGAVLGLYAPIMHIMIAEEFEADILPLIIGFIGIVVGPLQIGAGPILGSIRDSTGSYNVYIISLLGLAFITSTAMFGVACWRGRTNSVYEMESKS